MSWYDSINDPTVAKLTTAIFESAFACGEQLKAHINEGRFPTKEERHEQWGFLVWEYLFFFMHMFGRKAQQRLGVQRASQLCNELATCVVSGLTASMFPSSPQEIKEQIQAEFLEQLNQAEGAYSECEELMLPNDPLADKGLVNLLGKRVAEVCGRPHNPITLVRAQGAAVDGWTRIHMGELVDAVAREEFGIGKPDEENFFFRRFKDMIEREGRDEAQADLATEYDLFRSDYLRGRLSKDDWEKAERLLQEAAEALNLRYPGDPVQSLPREAPSILNDQTLPAVVTEVLGRGQSGQLTQEEEAAVHEMFGIIKDMLSDPEGEWRCRADDAEEINRSILAQGLWHYAHRQVVRSGYGFQPTPDKTLIEKAVSAVAKAYYAFQLPIFLYDVGSFFEMIGRTDRAREAFKEFLVNQSSFRASEIAQIWLNQRNVSEAVKDAAARVGR